MPELNGQMGTSSAITAATTEDPGHWEGDFWVVNGYKVERKWKERYEWLYINPDPDGSGKIECDDAVAKFMAKFTGAGGVWSNYQERHATLYGFFLGYHYIESTADIPTIPEWCKEDAVYFLSGLFAGREYKKERTANDNLSALQTILGLLRNRETLKRIAAIALAALTAGGVLVPPAIEAALKAAGVT